MLLSLLITWAAAPKSVIAHDPSNNTAAIPPVPTILMSPPVVDELTSFERVMRPAGACQQSKYRFGTSKECLEKHSAWGEGFTPPVIDFAFRNCQGVEEFHTRTLVVIALCALVGAQTFKSTVDHVAVPVTIHSELNEPVTHLRPDDFRVFDDGRPVAIVSLGKIRQSAHVLVLLDTSRSMTQSLSEVRSAASAVIARLAPGDTVQVGTFSSFLRLSPHFSSDDSQVAARLPLVPGGNMTILHDALVEGCSSFTSEMDRRAIFVVSDGIDTSSSASARAVMERAAETNVAIYAIGVSSRYVERGKPIVRAPDPILRVIAEDTGGAYVFAGTGEPVRTFVCGA
jgi:hypothetical protein